MGDSSVGPGKIVSIENAALEYRQLLRIADFRRLLQSTQGRSGRRQSGRQPPFRRDRVPLLGRRICKSLGRPGSQLSKVLPLLLAMEQE